MKCNTLRLTFLAIGLASFGVWAQPGLADPVQFFGWDNNVADITPRPNSDAAFNQFLGTLSSYGVESVDGIDTPIELVPGSGIHANFAPELIFRQNPTGTGSLTGVTASTQGVFATDGTPDMNLAIGTKSMSESEGLGFPPVNTRFTFNQPITAFGLYVMQGGDNPVPNPTTFHLSNSVTGYSADVNVPIGPNWGFHNIFFLGLGSAIPFDDVTIIETTDAGDGMVYDNVVAGNYVPEPGSLALLSLGGAYVCAVRRNRNSRRG
jgi:hypothetical protein